MTWITRRTEDLKIITELLDPNTSDRVVGVLAGAFVDDRLLLKIKARLIPVDEDSDLSAQVFEYGPLNSFGARINIGYMLGIYGDEVRRDLVAFCKIRNEFAHQTSTDFENVRVVRQLRRLKLLDRFRHPEQPTYFTGGGIDQMEAWFAPKGPFPNTGRGLYLASAQVLLGYLWYAPDLAPQKPEPLSPL